MPRENLKAKICSLCFNTKCDIDFKIVEVIKEVLEIVLPKLNLEEGDEHLICTSCSVKLFAAFNFKSVCTDTEDIIFPYVNLQAMPLVDLKEIYLKEKRNIQLIDILENQKICRLCFESVRHGFVSLNEVDADIIDNYIPELNFNATKDPVICKLCSDSLVTHGTFLSSCLATQEENNKVKSEWCIKTEEIKIEDDWESKPSPRLVNVETIGKTYTCNRCNFKTVHKGSLKRHCFKHISLTPTYISPKNQHKSKSRDASSPCPLRRQKRMYQCEKCLYRTSIREAFARHWLTHEVPSEVNVYHCEKCHYRTTGKGHFRHHQLKHENGGKVEKYTCDNCDFQTRYKCSLVTHQLLHKKEKREDVKCYITCDGEPMYKCNVCKYETKYKSQFLVHRCYYVNHGRKVQIYTCDNCDYQTGYRRNLLRHKLVHKKEKRKDENCYTTSDEEPTYKCNVCKYETKCKRQFSVHRCHYANPSKQLKFKCSLCRYESFHKDNWMKHRSKHSSGEKTFKCDVCSYQSIWKYNFLRHQLSHKNFSEVKTYDCCKCSYRTKYKELLKRHESLHSTLE